MAVRGKKTEKKIKSVENWEKRKIVRKKERKVSQEDGEGVKHA